MNNDKNVFSLSQDTSIVKEKRSDSESTIEKLPTELLQHIFVIGHNDLDDGVTVLFKPKSYIQTIMRVSANWRSLALAIPTIWTRISFSFNDRLSHHTAERNNQISAISTVLQKYLSLSGEHTLHIEFSKKFSFDVREAPLLQVIAATAPRWESLTLKQFYSIDAIMGKMKHNMSFTCLKSLSIEFVNSINISFKPTPVLTHITVRSLKKEPDVGYICAMSNISFRSAPSLTHLSVLHGNFPTYLFPDLPWAQITHFECIENNFAKDEIHKLLNRMTHLISLSFSGNMATNSVVTIPTLRTLNIVAGRIQWGTICITIDALRSVTAPQLDTLCLHVVAHRSDILRFLERSNCWLKELAISHTSLEEDWRTPRLQTVKRLCISQPSCIEKDIKWLTNGSFSSVLPELESIEIRDMPLDRKNVVSMLIAMLKSRLPATQRPWFDTGVLKRITINFQRKLDEDERKEWDEFLSSDTLWLPAEISVVEGG